MLIKSIIGFVKISNIFFCFGIILYYFEYNFTNMKQITKILSKYQFASEVQKAVKNINGAGLTYYKEGELVTRQSLVLKKTEDIEAYVIKTIQAYYRTTYKQGINNK